MWAEAGTAYEQTIDHHRHFEEGAAFSRLKAEVSTPHI
jgi:hypothetical protein